MHASHFEDEKTNARSSRFERPSRQAAFLLRLVLLSLCLPVTALLSSCATDQDTTFRFDEGLEEAVSLEVAKPVPVADGFRFDFDSAAEDKWIGIQGIRRMETRNGIMALDVAPGGFIATPRSVGFQADEIKEIVIRMKVNRGKFFGISWGQGSDQSAGIAIQNVGGYYIYPISTARLPTWQGRIQWLTIMPSDHPGGASAEIDFVEIVPSNSFVDSRSGTSEYWIEDERRNVFYVHSPSEVVFERTIPENARLDLGAGIVSRKSPTEFEVAIRAQEETVVFSEVVSDDSRWISTTIDLGSWAGQKVEIVFRTDSVFKGSAAVWSNPVLYQVDQARKNVVVYLIDTLRSDHLSCYGYHRNTSPEIDEFAAGGVIFLNSYSHASRTLESIPTIMSSLYSSIHNVKKLTSQLDDSFVTMAEAMRDAGYSTAAFITNVNAGVQNNNDQGFEFFFDKGAKLTVEPGHRTLPEEEVFSWIDSQKHRPFFAYIHTCEPHMPYEPPAPWDMKFDPGYKGNITGQRDGPYARNTATEPEDIRHLVALYDGEISFADYQFGRFLDALESQGLLDKTMIIVIADHGEELYEHGGWGHRYTLYQELLRVPIIVGGDERIPSGSTCEAVAGLVDIMPTVLGWADVELPEGVEGLNLLDLLESDERGTDRVVFAENYYPKHESIAMLDDDKKIIYNMTPRERGEVEFYDLATDKGENENLAGSSASEAMLARLKSLQSEKAGLSIGSTEEKQLDPETYERLKALGYIE